MSNRYAGRCYRCGEIVQPHKGVFERNYGRFRVQHHECRRAYAGGVSDYQRTQARDGAWEAQRDVRRYEERRAKEAAE